MSPWLLALAGCPAPECMDGFVRDDSGNCVAEPTDSVEDTGEPWPEPVVPEAPWDAEELAAKIDQLFAYGLPDQHELKDLYLKLLEEGRDAECPNSDGGVIFAMLTSSCVSNQGYTYYGIAGFGEGEKTPDDPQPDAADYHFQMAPASFRITEPDGDEHLAGGAYYYEVRIDDDGVATWQGEVNGTYEYAPAGELLGDGYSAGLDTDGWYAPDGSRAMALKGSLTLNGVATYIDGLSWDPAICDGVVQGAWRLRTDDGYWYELETGADCSPCGPVTYNGEPHSELCVDLAPVLADFADRMEVK